MTTEEIKNAIAALYEAAQALEEVYIENGGEVTDDTARREDEIEAIKALLNTEGVDSLGRWLKAKEDEKKALQAEKAGIDRRIKAVDRTIDYIKYEVGEVLRATGQDKVKGLSYGFAQSVSKHTEINYDAIIEDWSDIISKALKEAGIPEWLHVNLKTTVTDIAQAGGKALDYLDVQETDAVRFTKPVAAKEVKAD